MEAARSRGRVLAVLTKMGEGWSNMGITGTAHSAYFKGILFWCFVIADIFTK